MSTTENQNIWLKIREFFLKHETKIVLFVGFCLISAVSFEFGFMQGQKWQQKPLVIEKPLEVPEAQADANQVNSGTQETTKTVSTPSTVSKTTVVPTMAGCAYVGSKSSNKFYLPTCSYAKRVKPENLVCFKNAEEAIGQGRTES
ncbi:MAG: hypothetical protein ACD_67C00113G0001, partial [uncultured bacterium]